MSTFGRDSYQWRETYFVMFESERRPGVEEVKRALSKLPGTYELSNLTADDAGGFESVTLMAPGEFSAVDISYLTGEDVLQEGARLVEELGATAPKALRERLAGCDARFDLMHFEHMLADEPDDSDEVFDPGALLLALEALVKLTGGIGIDPQSGTLM